jgi:hypothetical protein
MPVGPVARDMTHPQSYHAIGNAIFAPARC